MRKTMRMIFYGGRSLKRRDPLIVPQEQMTIARHFNAGFDRKSVVTTIAFLIFFSLSVKAETNSLSDAEIQGQTLAQKILAQRPTAYQTNSGILQIHDPDGHRSEFPVQCTTFVTPAAPSFWEQIYEADFTNHFIALVVMHPESETNVYLYNTNRAHQVPVMGDLPLVGAIGGLFNHHQSSGTELMTPFAGSDFWLCDLGLEFFHWPQQKVLKKEFHRQCACTVLESTNPNPSPDGYSRVVCWIDNDSLGIVEAYAYDARGRKLKNFYPKDFEKVHDQYQLESMVMENLQTGSKSVIEFDLDK